MSGFKLNFSQFNLKIKFILGQPEGNYSWNRQYFSFRSNGAGRKMALQKRPTPEMTLLRSDIW
jgi:hypothetical protein